MLGVDITFYRFITMDIGSQIVAEFHKIIIIIL
jgi:hypothetical protein